MVVMMDAGTTIPPMPRPAKTRSPHKTWRLSARATAIEPTPRIYQHSWLFSQLTQACTPAVIKIELPTINARLCPLSTLNNQSTATAPTKIPNAMGRPRTPTPMGSWPYTLKDCVGQKRRTAKKLAPETKVMMRVQRRIRGFCKRREGNMGYLVNLASQITKAIRRTMPRTRGAMT